MNDFKNMQLSETSVFKQMLQCDDIIPPWHEKLLLETHTMYEAI